MNNTQKYPNPDVEGKAAGHPIYLHIGDLILHLDADLNCKLGKECEKSRFINCDPSKLGRVLLNKVRDEPKEGEEGVKMEGRGSADEGGDIYVTVENLCPPSASVLEYARERQALSGQ